MGIGLKIKELADKKKITLPELAKRIGRTKQAVYDMVEKEDISTSILRKLSAEFNVPISYFFDDKDANVQIITGNNNKTVGIGDISQTVDRSETSFLNERIKYLEALLEEKERLINVLMEKNTSL